MAAITSAVIAVGTATMSFVQAAKQKEDSDIANDEAARLMADARKRAEVDNFEELSVPTESFEAEFEANLAADQQAVQALQEGDARSLAAGVGRIGSQQAEEAEDTRIAMGQDLYNLDVTKAESRDAVNQQLIALDVGEAGDKAQMGSDLLAASSDSFSQGVSSVGSGLSSFGDTQDAYSSEKRKTNRANRKSRRTTRQGERAMNRYAKKKI
jgi:putative Ca2+/H+ antiporter (TMEM165/GDT1 family)